MDSGKPSPLPAFTLCASFWSFTHGVYLPRNLSYLTGRRLQESTDKTMARPERIWSWTQVSPFLACWLCVPLADQRIRCERLCEVPTQCEEEGHAQPVQDTTVTQTLTPILCLQQLALSEWQGWDIWPGLVPSALIPRGHRNLTSVAPRMPMASSLHQVKPRAPLPITLLTSSH